MNWEMVKREITLVSIGIAVVVMSGFVTVRVLVPQLTQFLTFKDPRQYEIRGTGEVKGPKTLLDEKRERLLNLPSISLHYSDSERITNFYNDYFREPTIESLVQEIVSEASGEAGAKVPEILVAKIGTKDLSKWVQKVKLPETSINGMFRRYQRETIKNNQVSLSLDIVDVELSELDAFNATVKQLESYGIQLDTKGLQSKRQELRAKSAGNVIERLEHASGVALVEGRFEISDHSDKYYKCRLLHPVNDFLVASKAPVFISFLIPKAQIAEFVAGNYSQSVGKVIPLKVYGDVWRPVDRANDVFELQITPLAVYQ